ncbi:hypothetical protein Bpfe_030660 [Biomphalaria pfeifferi]|uniref:Uncharacterized protein n=1 Tax=Biomphalaria pfeifferi TaxID=112525 RepID=A0AAD8AP94_BIOPF|nr:hypothetical protein Bpfe_030660 [Biomphalaria pfeifferi]
MGRYRGERGGGERKKESWEKRREKEEEREERKRKKEKRDGKKEKDKNKRKREIIESKNKIGKVGREKEGELTEGREIDREKKSQDDPQGDNELYTNCPYPGAICPTRSCTRLVPWIH